MHSINIYELMTWKRRNPKFFSFGPSIVPCVLSALLVFVPSVILLVCLIIKQNYELIGFLILSNISTHLFMVKCVTTNPGIIPQHVPRRQSHSDNFQIPESRLNQQDCRYLLPNTNLNLYTKYCYECRIFRPPRAIHCSKCNHCVERYDHHCPWLAVCIGRFNYRYFLGYVGSLTVLSWYTFVVSLEAFVNELRRNARFTSYLAQTLVGLLSLFFALPLLRLLFYHLSVIRKNRTTNQDLKKTYMKYLPLSFPTWPIDRDSFFTQQTQYYMQKSVSFSMGSKHHDSSKMKEIMMASIVRQLNDSTSSSSSSVVMRGERYSMNTERTSVFNYLLQTQHE